LAVDDAYTGRSPHRCENCDNAQEEFHAFETEKNSAEITKAS